MCRLFKNRKKVLNYSTLLRTSSTCSITLKRKAASPASPADGSKIGQVDGPAPSPPSSPEERRPPSAPSSPGCVRTPTLVLLVPWAPPPAPLWSKFLLSHARMVICGKCLAGCHGLCFQMCHACFNKANVS